MTDQKVFVYMFEDGVVWTNVPNLEFVGEEQGRCFGARAVVLKTTAEMDAKFASASQKTHKLLETAGWSQEGGKL